MKKKETGKKNHLIIEQRKKIEKCLDHEVNFKVIGRWIVKDPSTVSYEVKRRRKNTVTSV